MDNHTMESVEYLVLIADRKQKDELLSRLCKVNCRCVNTMYGKGTVKSSYLMDMLGLVPEENKVIMTCVMPKGISEKVFAILTEEFHFGHPNTGIAFTMPLLGMSF